MKKEEDKTPDVSYMWHSSDELIKYEELIPGSPDMANACNKASATGFRLALRKLEDLGIIKMEDLDRSPNEEDKKLWDESFEIEG